MVTAVVTASYRSNRILVLELFLPEAAGVLVPALAARRHDPVVLRLVCNTRQ